MSADDDINELIAAAAASSGPPIGGHSLRDLYSLVSTAGVADSLDALSILSVLLPLTDPAARDLIGIMGECSSAKEVIMAAQEEVEKIADRTENDESDSGDGEPTKSETAWADRLIEIVGLYRAAVPRLKLRNRSASETLQPLLNNLRRAVEAVSSQMESTQAVDLMATVGDMVNDVLKWVKDLPGVEPEDLTRCQVALRTLLEHTLILSRHLLRYDTARQTFEICFPRLRMDAQAENPGDLRGPQIIEQYTLIYDNLGYTRNDLVSLPSLASVILLVHASLTSSSPALISILPSFYPTLLSMLHPASNIQDDAIAFLLLALHQNQTRTRSELSPDIIHTLLPPVVDLSSAHPSPSTRHQAFRVVSLLLASGTPQLRFQLLADLVARCEYPQMRVAVVTLTKEAVLEVLSIQPPNTSSVFGSSMFMRVFGPLMFRPSPPDIFDKDSNLNLEEFLESPEPKRIMEVLSLYYVILSRDKTNVTGIRDKDLVNTVEKNLLQPLDSWLEVVLNKERATGNHDHATGYLSLLRVGLNRVREAKSNL